MMIPGGWGRPIVGWVGVFMFVSCLTGIWLWWPLSGGFRSGFQWKRRNTTNANLHYLTGFWILIPLAMLSFTGAWISFPSVFSAFESRPARGPGGPGGGRAGRRSRSSRPRPRSTPRWRPRRPLATGPLLSDRLADRRRRPNGPSSSRPDGPPAEVKVADADATALPPEPPRPETLARTMRRWHDGTDMGTVWQIVIFLGGIIPALLSVTGIIIWWRARKRRRAQAELAPATA